MKRIFYYLAFSVLILTGIQAQVQTIDISTGILNGTGYGTSTPATMLAVNANDDTWQLGYPPSPGFLPTSYSTVKCGSGTNQAPNGTLSPTPGGDPAVRWLTPVLDPLSGNHLYGAYGFTYYKTTFNLFQFCALTTGIIYFKHIAVDNNTYKIFVNGDLYSVNYQFSPPTTNATLDITGSLIPGSNEIIIEVENQGMWSGININGYLQIGYSGASFCSSTNGNAITLTPPITSGGHSWVVYTGNSVQGPFSYQGSYYTPSITLDKNGHCYYVKHTVEECGTACEARTICFEECSETPLCDIGEPRHTVYYSETGIFSWTAVPGAVSYEIEIIPNDPSCCEGQQAGTTITIPLDASYNNYVWDRPANLTCFSWRVKAFCENDTYAASAKQCVYY